MERNLSHLKQRERWKVISLNNYICKIKCLKAYLKIYPSSEDYHSIYIDYILTRKELKQLLSPWPTNVKKSYSKVEDYILNSFERLKKTFNLMR